MSIYFRFYSSNHWYQDGIKNRSVIVIPEKVNMDVNIAIVVDHYLITSEYIRGYSKLPIMPTSTNYSKLPQFTSRSPI